MRRWFFIGWMTIFLFITWTSCQPTEMSSATASTNFLVSNAWIDSIKNYQVGDDLAAYHIVEQLALGIKDTTIEIATVTPFKPLFIDLDGDFLSEIILEIGDLEDKYILVLQQQKGVWRCIFIKEIWQKYEDKPLYVVNNYNPNKLFYFATMEASGTELYSEVLYFYKLIDGAVVECLRVVQESHISGWGGYWDQSYENTFALFDWPDRDGIEVAYRYHLTPNPMAVPFSINEEANELSQEGHLHYNWNAAAKKYLPDWKALETNYHPFTAQKMAALDLLGGNDSLIYLAFQTELRAMMDTTTGEKQHFLQAYKHFVKKEYGLE